jgi:hypothetical protein
MMYFNFLIATALSTLTLQTAIAEPTATVLMRGNHFKPYFSEETLPDLVSETHFDGRFFKIVKGRSEEPIPLDEKDEALNLKAATTYFHLNKARSFWVNEMNSDYVRTMPKITIRLDITNKFSDLGHYQHESIDPQFNNALSIPPGTPMDGVEIPAWGPEIWFRPVKVIRTEDLPANGLGAQGNPLTRYAAMLSGPVRSSATNRFIQLTLQKIFNPDSLRTPYRDLVIRQFATIAATAVLMEATKRSDRFFIEKYYYLDTAMIPEIIYHEFAHIALSDHLALSLSTPMLEGMADYFATAVAKNPHIASKIKDYSLSMPKNAKNKNTYDPIYETNLFANSDFVLSVLWRLGIAFPENGSRLIYEARNRLKTETSDIRHDLIGSLLESCNQFCEYPRRDRMILRGIFEEKGF